MFAGYWSARECLSAMAKCDIVAEPLVYIINLSFIQDWKEGMRSGINMRIQIS
jgi:hypothetical protein